MNKVSSIEQFQTIIINDKPSVAVFKTTWCKDCHYIDPFMPELEMAYADRLTFFEIDRDELPELCEQYNILGIPSFVVLQQGGERHRFVSKLRKTREEIESFLDEALAACVTKGA